MSLAPFSPGLRSPHRSYADVVRHDDLLADIHRQDTIFQDALIPEDEHLRSQSPPPLLRFGEPHPPPLDASPPPPSPPTQWFSPPTARVPLSNDERQDPDPPLQSQPTGSLFAAVVEDHFQGHEENLQGVRMPKFSASNLNDLEEALFTEAVSHDFMLKRRSSQEYPAREGHPRRHYLRYQCIRGGTYQNKVDSEARQREPTTRLTNCPYAFRVRLVPAVDEDNEERYKVIDHTGDPKSDTHNHPPITAGQSHHMRRLPAAIVTEIRTMSASAMSPLEIFSLLSRRYPSECEVLLIGDIYRHRKRMRAEQLCGVGSAEALRRSLEAGKYPDLLYRVDQRDDDNTLHGLIWSWKSARLLAHRFGKVFTLDVTYNGNRHGHKILHLCGFAATNQTFTIALAAMPDEVEETVTHYLRHLMDLLGHLHPFVVVMDRAIALRNAVSTVWPNTRIVLCQWHIMENLRQAIAEAVAPYRKAAPKTEEAASRLSVEQIENNDLLWMRGGRLWLKADWDKQKAKIKEEYERLVVNAQTEIELANGLEEWQRKWERPRWLGIFDRVLEKGVRYVEEDGDGFVACRKNDFLHFDQRTTSRIEAQHASLRPYIGDRPRRRVLALDTLVAYTIPKFTAQFSDITSQMDYEMCRRPALHTEHLTHAVRTPVSEHALNKIRNQIGIARNIVLRTHGERFHSDGSRIPETRPCTQHWRRSVGLPCAHEIAKILDVSNGGSGVLDVTQFDSQWWLSSSAYLQRLMDTVEQGVGNSSGVVLLDADDLPVPGQRRLRDPITQAARRAAEGTQRRPRASQTSTGRLLTQAELADGPANPRAPPCPACGRRHAPGSRPCRESLLTGVAVVASQATVDNVDGTELATTAEAADLPDQRPRQRPRADRPRRQRQEVDFFTVPDRFADCRPSDVDYCPFCPIQHTRRWCNAMYEWRRWRKEHQAVLQETQETQSDQDSDQVVSETLEEPQATRTRQPDPASVSMPATPNRLSPVRRSPTGFDEELPELDDLFQSVTDRNHAIRTQRLGSIHHEYAPVQPSQVLNAYGDTTSRMPSVIPETQLDPAEEPAMEGLEGSEVVTTPMPAANGGVDSTPSTPSPPKRRRCSP